MTLLCRSFSIKSFWCTRIQALIQPTLGKKFLSGTQSVTTGSMEWKNNPFYLTECWDLLEKQTSKAIVRTHSNELPNRVNPGKGGLAKGVWGLVLQKSYLRPGLKINRRFSGTDRGEMKPSEQEELCNSQEPRQQGTIGKGKFIPRG